MKRIKAIGSEEIDEGEGMAASHLATGHGTRPFVPVLAESAIVGRRGRYFLRPVGTHELRIVVSEVDGD